MIERDTLAELKAERYAGWDGELGTRILEGGFTLASLADEAISRDLHPKHVSGRQEQLENLVNRYIHG
jgi:xylose isomerase